MTVTWHNMVCPVPRVTRVMLECLVIMVTRENMEPRGRGDTRVCLVLEGRLAMQELQEHLETKETQEELDLLVCQVSMVSTVLRGRRGTRESRVV